NVDGLRVAVIAGGVETRYLLDTAHPNAQVALEYKPGGAIATAYAYGLRLISESHGGAISFYLMDGYSGVRLLANSSGAVTDRYVYDAYGKILSSLGTTFNEFLYRGEQYDANLG